MQLVEKTIIKKSHPYYKELDHLSFLSKNLYNAVLYVVRQEFFKTRALISAFTIRQVFKDLNQSDYIALPRMVSMCVIFQVEADFKSFLRASKEWKINPNKFKSKPKLPKYKDRIEGRNLLSYDKQTLSLRELDKGIIKLSQTNIAIPSKNISRDNANQVQIVGRTNCYVIYATYTVSDVEPKPLSTIASIDLGVNNLAAITFSNNQQPILINGKPLKSINQFFNKKKATLQSQLKGGKKSSNRIEKLTFKRNNKVNDYLHKSSRYIINQLASKGVSHLIIGYNPEWKQEINIGAVNNQTFVQIPFARFIEMLSYKAKLVGITVKTNEESYTSKCSFLDLESIQKHEEYLGRRMKRGLFKSANGKKINADINSSYNILRKVAPNAFSNGVEGVAVHPISVSL